MIQEEYDNHFLGIMIYLDTAIDYSAREFSVIDGQQRLTTITIMLCAICIMYSEYKDEAHFRGVKKYIIGTDDMGADYVRVDNQDLKNYQYIVAEPRDIILCYPDRVWQLHRIWKNRHRIM